jgi:hypothetical protein
VAVAFATAAAAAPPVGVTEDATKYADDGGASLFSALRELGGSENRMTVYWDPAHPATIQERAFLDRSLPVAAAFGIRVTFAVYPADPLAFATDTDTRIALFSAYVKLVAATYPQVRTFVILNEPNEAFFQAPQHGPGGEIVSAPVAERVLAGSYDALKSLDPGITVVGLGLSPEANDVTSTSPVRFLQALGNAYRSSARTAPLMDELGFHLYPRDPSREDQSSHLDWPNVGPADLGRIKQAAWDAFAGTAQPVFAEGAAGGLRLRIDEIGWQAAVPSALAGAYTGVENAPVTDEARQAQVYGGLVRSLSCDPSVSALMFFHLIDQTELRGLQTGLLRANGSPRPSFGAVRDAIANRGCGAGTVWAHATGVVAASASFASGATSVTASAGEGADGVAALLRVPGPLASGQAARVLGGQTGTGVTVVASVHRALRTGRQVRFNLPPATVPGTYMLAVKLTATANAQRTTTLVSAPLRVT